jgi:signal transduction histidine kinase
VHADLEGSGLGLAIVKEIAQRHGGTVALSEAAPPMNGARVTLSFPSALAIEPDPAHA